MVFADGNQHKLKNSFAHQLRLCGNKAAFAFIFEDYTITYPAFAKGDPVVYITTEKSFKEIPTGLESLDYIRGFLRGWKEFDGYGGSVKQIHSINKKAIDFFSEWCWIIGCVVSGNIRENNAPTNFGERTNTLYSVNFQTTTNFQGFKVVNITPANRRETVWCIVEPKYSQFTLEYGISTGNCFLLRGEEDTREEWGRLMHRASDCLMTGGGIGVDYSIFRPEGRPLSKTGGVSSGPIPLMSAINEIGRSVMQGGSRRSAIYASLNWLHEDIPMFMKVKNWSDEHKAMRARDFNFPCPLDMTNISINYDNKWKYNADRANLHTFCVHSHNLVYMLYQCHLDLLQWF